MPGPPQTELPPPKGVSMPSDPQTNWDMVEAVATAVQAIILSVSAIVAVGLFYFRGQQERRRAALGVVEHILSKEFNDLRAEARRIMEADREQTLLDFENQDAVGGRAKVIHILNYYEYVCRRAAEGAISNQVFKQHIFAAVENDWMTFKPFAQKARERFNDETICENVERWVAQGRAEREAEMTVADAGKEQPLQTHARTS